MTLWDIVTDEIVLTVEREMPEADCLGARQYVELYGYITDRLVSVNEFFWENDLPAADEASWDRYRDEVWLPYLASLGWSE